MRPRPHVIAAGYTTTEGSAGPLILNGGPTNVREIVDVMQADEVGYFYLDYQDGRPGYVKFRGTFNGVNELSIDEVLVSSDPGGDFPDLLVGVKVVRRALAEREIVASMRAYHNKPLHHPIIVLDFGDSNAYGSATATEAMDLNSRVKDWTNKDDVVFRLRVSDPNRPLWVGTTNPHTGYVEGNIGNQGWAHSDCIANELIRDVVMVQITAPGVTAQYFKPGAAGGDEVKAQFDAAIAAIRIAYNDNSISYADDVLINLGHNDASTGRTAKQFNEDMHTIKRALEDPNQWGIVDPRNVRYFLYDLPYHRNETKLHFNGLQLFDSQTDENVCIIGTERARQIDSVHHDGNYNNDLGRASAKARLHDVRPKSRGGAWTVRRSSKVFAAEYIKRTNGSSAPPAGSYRWDPVGETLSVYKTDNLAATPELDQMVDWDRLTFIDQGAPANFEEFRLTSTPSDQGSFWRWGAVLEVTGGALADDTVCDVIAGPEDATFEKEVFDEQENVAHTEMGIASDDLGGVGNAGMYLEGNRVRRSLYEHVEPVIYEDITDQSTIYVAVIHVPDDLTRIEGRYLVVGRKDGSLDTARAEIQFSGGRNDASYVTYAESRDIGPADVTIGFANFAPGHWITMTTTAGGKWRWTTYEWIREIPLVPDP